MKTYKIIPNYLLLGMSFAIFIIYVGSEILNIPNLQHFLLISILGVILSILYGKIKEEKTTDEEG